MDKQRLWFIRWMMLALSAVTPASCDTLTEAMRREDPRLEQRVSFVSPRIYIGELLEQLTKSTNVSLEAGARDGAADPQIAVYLRDTPLADALDALWSLVSYQGAAWTWERTGEAGAFAYHLRRPLAARTLAARLREQVQADFENEAAVKRSYLSLTSEQLRDKARHDPYADALAQFPRDQAGLATFFTTLPPEQQARVLRGQEDVTIPVERLSAQGRAFVRMVWSEGEHFRINPHDGSRTPAPEPGFIRINTTRNPSTIAPILAIELEGAGGYGYLGGMPLERTYRKLVSDLWMLPGDRATDPQAERSLPRPKTPDPPTPENVKNFRPRFDRFADAAPFSLLARLPSSAILPAGEDPGAPFGQTVSAFLQRLQAQPYHIRSKWRDGVLLLSYPAWFQEEEADAPWTLVKRLREREKAGGGYLSLEDLARAAEPLSVPQLKRLAVDFPAMNGVIYLHGLFVQLARSPGLLFRLRSVQGVPLAELLPALADVPGFLPPDGAPEGAYVRLQVKETLLRREMMFTVYAPDGRPVSGTVLTAAPRRPEPEQTTGTES